MVIERDSLVDDVMREWPAAIRAFLDFRMRCIGCPIGVFHTVEDACREHGVETALFLDALRAAAGPDALSGDANAGLAADKTAGEKNRRAFEST